MLMFVSYIESPGIFLSNSSVSRMHAIRVGWPNVSVYTCPSVIINSVPFQLRRVLVWKINHMVILFGELQLLVTAILCDLGQEAQNLA